MIHPQRIQALNDAPVARGRFVLYWMQASVRATGNHALEHAIREANRLRQPVLAGFGLTADFPEANARHYTFLLEGLSDASRALARRGIPLVIRRGAPDEVAADLARGASLVVTDRGYLRVQREWRARAAARVSCPLVQVESDVVVPVETALGKEAYSAAVLRPRLQARLREFLVPLRATAVRHGPPARVPETLVLDDIPARVRELGVDASVPPVPGVRGGARAARARLESFLARGLARYAEDRNDPALAGQSGLSPYLHFGHISPLEIALAVGPRRGAGARAFLEELIVRRELSVNFTHYHALYDRYECLPAWCRATLMQHARDPRPYRYSPEELEQGRTHDRYWNAAQMEMVLTGTMHGYLRMYWGKKLLEWTDRPEDAFALALRLNNRYQLDGRDPNGFAGVAWCFGKHDRPWAERPVFGLVRYMNARGLERKFDVEAYARRIEGLPRTASAGPA
jgi:deoxyribodipyrimidine photo-lyase